MPRPIEVLDGLAEHAVSPAAGLSQATWDGALQAFGGHLLQSWRWGTFKERHGWRVERRSVSGPRGTGMAQVLYRHRGPISLGYVPRGPALAGSQQPAMDELLADLDLTSRRHRALALVFEPDRPLPPTNEHRTAYRLHNGTSHVQPARTVKVPLLDDGALLDQMHQKTRYNVRLAQRRGVTVGRASGTAADVGAFFALLEDTSRRNEFAIHTRAYYQDFLDIFAEDALLVFAYVEGNVAAGLIAARFGDEAIYMYGASSTEHRAHGAGFYLQFEAMRWAREQGCRRYDLWGIPEKDPPSTEGEGHRVAGTKGDDWRGLYKFKVGFGGEIVTYPPTMERRYHPQLLRLARRFAPVRG